MLCLGTISSVNGFWAEYYYGIKEEVGTGFYITTREGARFTGVCLASETICSYVFCTEEST